MNPLAQRWAGLAAREKAMLAGAGLVVGLALLWWVALAPALQTLRAANAQHAQVDAQLQSMRLLAAEATALRGQRALGYEESLRNLENSVKQTFGAGATLSVSDARASLTLKGVSADALAQWLSQARINARVVPSEARLQRSAAGAAAPALAPSSKASSASATPASPTASVSPGPVLWDGVLVLALPAR
jgi:general secretion pathway protein M